MQTLAIKPTDTPKTDAVEEAWDHLCLPRIIWNHARELERKNAALREALEFAASAYDDEQALFELSRRLYDVSCVARKALGKEAQP